LKPPSSITVRFNSLPARSANMRAVLDSADQIDDTDFGAIEEFIRNGPAAPGA